MFTSFADDKRLFGKRVLFDFVSKFQNVLKSFSSSMEKPTSEKDPLTPLPQGAVEAFRATVFLERQDVLTQVLRECEHVRPGGRCACYSCFRMVVARVSCGC